MLTGRLVPAGDPAALAAALVEALTSREAQGWAAAARRHAARGFSLDRVAEQYIDLYRTLAPQAGWALKAES